MRPRPDPSRPTQTLYDEADAEDLTLACASSGCSSCIYYFDIDEGARRPTPTATIRSLRRERHGHRAPHRH
jgi:hypothetical protein